jgi:hypothetical protein
MEVLMRAFPTAALASMASACATHGLPSDSPPVAPDSARLVVFRAAETPQYAIRSARLKVDASEPDFVPPGEFRTFTVAAGSHTLFVDMWDVPGQCELSIEVAGGREHFYEIAPRGANAAATMPMMLIPFNSLGNVILGGATMMAGLAAESNGKACGGAYSIVEVEQALAAQKLSPLPAPRQPQ